MSIPLTRAEPAAMTCDEPGCTCNHHDGLFMRSNCHLDAGVTAFYREGLLAISCAECDSPIIALVIGDVPAGPDQ